MLAEEFPDVQFVNRPQEADIILFDSAAESDSGAPLNFLDKQLLYDSSLRAQSYVLRTDTRPLWIVGGGASGVLYGVGTLLQLLRRSTSGIEAPGVYVRDYPDFEYRAASDWLLAAEVNRWSLDRGHGLGDYERQVRRRIDRAARYKVNVALVDGFGWSFEHRPSGYANLMLSLNRYARERGVHLQFGGYGAAYDIAQREGEYQGHVFLNRASYPDGPVYRCMAYAERKTGIDPRTMGTCRANDELNHLKGQELARFVDRVEPGFLYIHHEDCCVYEDLQKAWLGRCDRCAKRWPNDSLLAPDGGAGALAHGYSSLIDAVNQVRHPSAGYEASRDTQIVLVSPVYMPDSEKSSEWSHVMELWRNIARLLPKSSNVQICFREVLPQAGGGERWVEIFNSVMKAEHLPFGAYVFVVGGADNFLTDYGTSGIPAMNAYYRGARTIYNGMGDAYREPLELLAAEYSWNTRSTGFFRSPRTEGQMRGIDQWIYTPASPPELFGPGLIFDRICERLYGQAAGPIMSRYYRDAAWIPDVEVPANPPDRAYYRGRKSGYLPGIWNYAMAIPSYWNHLAMDAQTWGREPDERYRGRIAQSLPVAEIHRRLAHRWTLAADLNARGATRIREALAAGPQPESVEDLHFLATLFESYQPLLEALREYHTVRAAPDDSGQRDRLESARRHALQSDELAARYFPEPVDPVLGEIRSLRTYPRRLAEAIAAWEKIHQEKLTR